MRRGRAHSLAAAVVLLWCITPRAALADATALEDLAAVHRACEDAGHRSRPRLWAIDIEPGWRFESDAEALAIDTRRNLRALGGRVSVLMSGFEPIELEQTGDDAARLRAEQAHLRLRLGFFLGFDDAQHQACVVRNRHSVTTIRADLAFVQLLNETGEVVVNAEYERLRAWRDDEVAAIPGAGPRGLVGEASFATGQPAPPSWQSALENTTTRGRLAECHRAGVQSGASGVGQVVVRLNVETRTGRIRRADVALSSLGNDAEAQCVAHALGRSTSLPPGPTDWRAEVVDLSVPVRFTDE